jgi:hypothetical protein
MTYQRKRNVNHFESTVKQLNKTCEKILLHEPEHFNQKVVFARCVFERIIEVDTKSERFDVEAVIESSWHDDQVLNKLLKNEFGSKYF